MYFPPIENPEQITKDPTLRAIKPWWILVVGAAVLYLAPAQALLELPVVGAIVNWLASLIPSIARWVELSPFPYNTKLFAVFVWLMILVQSYWLISTGSFKKNTTVQEKEENTEKSLRLRIFALLKFLFLLSVFIATPWNFAIIDTPPCSVCVNTVKWAQLFIGCTFSITAAGLIAMFFVVVQLLFKSFTSKGINHG